MQKSSSPSSRTYDASGRQAEAQQRRRRVAAAAERLFLDQGYAATSIAEIAGQAGVSAQMVYAAFGGKAGILARIVDTAAAGDEDDIVLRQRPETVAALAIAEPRERLDAIARLGAQVNARVGRILEIVHSASAADTSVGELRDRIEANIRSDTLAVARAVLSDVRTDLTVEEVADVLRTLGGHRTWQALVVEGGWSQQRYADWLDDALTRLLLP